jgi:hypothetical protein
MTTMNPVAEDTFSLLPQLNFRALHEKQDEYLHTPRLFSSFRRLLHETTLICFHIKTEVHFVQQKSSALCFISPKVDIT